MERKEVTRKIVINGIEQEVAAPPEMRLLDVIRLKLKLTGTKEGCGEGECGACTILYNDAAIDSCLTFFGQLKDLDRITTIEGLGDASSLMPLQESFAEKGAVQCGSCIPGMLIAAHALLIKNPKPTREEIAVALAGNLCRCTGYKKIFDAIEKAAEAIRKK